MGDWPNEGKLSALNIRRACDASLRRLRTDYIDLYQMHHVDRDTPWDEIWQAMEVLVAQGKILYVGLVQLRRLAHRAGLRDRAGARLPRPGQRAVAVQPGHPRRSSLRCCPPRSAYGVGVIPWSPLERRAARRRAEVRAGGAPPAGRPGEADGRGATGTSIEAYEDLCDKLGEEPADVALAWLLHQDGVTAPIIGPRTLAQFDGAQRALEITLDADVLARLDEIFPGYKPAPEHYAW